MTPDFPDIRAVKLRVPVCGGLPFCARSAPSPPGARFELTCAVVRLRCLQRRYEDRTSVAPRQFHSNIATANVHVPDSSVRTAPPLPFSWGGRAVRGLLAGLGYILGPRAHRRVTGPPSLRREGW